MRFAIVCMLFALLPFTLRAADIVPAGSKPELLWNEGEFTEGVAVAKDGTVFFSDIGIGGQNPGRIMKYDPTTGKTSVYVANSGQSNGLFFNRQGELLACCGAQQGLRALCRVNSDGTMKVLVDKFEGKKFNAPNDLVVHPRGWIYFSDPRYVGSEPLELDSMNVYRFADGKVTLATSEVSKPNGVILSPDAKTLYVAENNNGATGVEPPGTPAKPPRFTLNAFAVRDDGTLGPKRVLAEFPEGGIDGMSSDTQGHVYGAYRQESRMGILVFSSEGKELAHIPTESLPTNCTFGVGSAADVLYITAGTGLYKIKLNATGYHPELQ